jgi:uncharacterized protein
MKAIKELHKFDRVFIESIIKLYSNKDKAHDFTHIERIFKNLRKFGGIKNRKTVHLAALIHGVQKKKETRLLLEKYFGKVLAENVLNLCRNAKRKPKTVDEKILHDAQLLEVFGAIGIARSYTKGGYENQTLKETTRILEKNIKRKFLTKTGAKLAEGRILILKEFLKQLKREL